MARIFGQLTIADVVEKRGVGAVGREDGTPIQDRRAEEQSLL